MNYSRILRKIRQRIFDYHDAGKGVKADRVLRLVKDRAMRSPEAVRARNHAKMLEDERILRAWN